MTIIRADQLNVDSPTGLFVLVQTLSNPKEKQSKQGGCVPLSLASHVRYESKWRIACAMHFTRSNPKIWGKVNKCNCEFAIWDPLAPYLEVKHGCYEP